MDARIQAIAGAVVAIVLGSLVPGRAGAATWLVDATADAQDAAAGDGLCADALGRCTLRAAVQTAGAGDEIVLPPGTFLLGSTLDLRSMDVTVTGAGADLTVLSTDGSFPISDG